MAEFNDCNMQLENCKLQMALDAHLGNQIENLTDKETEIQSCMITMSTLKLSFR